MRVASDRLQTTSDQRRNSRWALVASAIAAAFLVVVATVVVVVVPDLLNCSPPSDKDLTEQEAFVRAHFADARDVESGVADCDDNGQGYVNFTTSLSPAAARDLLLADPSCSNPQQVDGMISVRCRSSRSNIDINFDTSAGDGTTGELDFK